MATVSIVIPVYNEEATICSLVEKVLAVQFLHNRKKQIIIVNDCSTDNTSIKITEFINHKENPSLLYVVHEKNMGKGAAIHTGIKMATGDYTIIQDADLEYDPEDYGALLKPLLQNMADVVYGSRFIGDKPHRVLFFWHYIGNRMLTLLSNMFTNLNLTDMETCYKVFKTDILKSVKLREKRFGFEPEVTAKVARIPGIRIYEVGISYYGRTYMEGKKIKWQDGFHAIYCILKYNVFGK